MLLFVGWGIARLARAAAKKVIASFNSVFGKLFKHHYIEGEHFHSSYAPIICQVVFWCVMFFFAAASANLLGWNVFSGWLGGVVEYLPRLLTDILFQLTDEELSSLFSATEIKSGLLQSYLFFAIELSGSDYSRTALSGITRQLNGLFPMPVMVLFSYRLQNCGLVVIQSLRRQVFG